MVPFEAEKFEPYMKTVVRPWLQDHVKDGVPWMGWKPDSFLLCKEPFRKGHHRHAPRILRLLWKIP